MKDGIQEDYRAINHFETVHADKSSTPCVKDGAGGLSGISMNCTHKHADSS